MGNGGRRVDSEAVFASWFEGASGVAERAIEVIPGASAVTCGGVGLAVTTGRSLALVKKETVGLAASVPCLLSR